MDAFIDLFAIPPNDMRTHSPHSCHPHPRYGHSNFPGSALWTIVNVVPRSQLHSPAWPAYGCGVRDTRYVHVVRTRLHVVALANARSQHARRAAVHILATHIMPEDWTCGSTCAASHDLTPTLDCALHLRNFFRTLGEDLG